MLSMIITCSSVSDTEFREATLVVRKMIPCPHFRNGVAVSVVWWDRFGKGLTASDSVELLAGFDWYKY